MLLVALGLGRGKGWQGTERVFSALLPKEEGGQGVKGVLAIAGDGPAKEALIEEATRLRLRVVFLGNVPHKAHGPLDGALEWRSCRSSTAPRTVS